MHKYNIKENNDVLSYNKVIYSVITNNSIIKYITALKHLRLNYIELNALNKLNIVKNSDYNFKCEECLKEKVTSHINYNIN